MEIFHKLLQIKRYEFIIGFSLVGSELFKLLLVILFLLSCFTAAFCVSFFSST